MAGNRCGHNSKRPRLNSLEPIRKGKGGLPRILSLAAERAKEWYRHPQKCTALNKGSRQTRSERREAYQIILETMLSFLDLASLCLGTPTIDHGFVDVNMKALVAESGMSQRRCERAIADLKDAGLMEVKQPRGLNEYGDYIGLRAIRVIKSQFFEYLKLGPMLQRERAKATVRLRRKAAQASRKLTDLMRRASTRMRNRTKQSFQKFRHLANRVTARAWNTVCAQYLVAGLDPDESRRRTNTDLGLPEDYSPGYSQ